MTRSIARTFWCVAIAASTMILAEDGKKINTKGGICQATVPASWKADAGLENFNVSTSKDDDAMARLIFKPQDMSFGSLKAIIRQSFLDAKVTKDSATAFEMEGQLNGDPLVYRLIPTPNRRFCEVLVTYKSGVADQARKIAWSLKSGK